MLNPYWRGQEENKTAPQKAETKAHHWRVVVIYRAHFFFDIEHSWQLYKGQLVAASPLASNELDYFGLAEKPSTGFCWTMTVEREFLFLKTPIVVHCLFKASSFWKIGLTLWSRKKQPIPVFLLEKFYEERNLLAGSMGSPEWDTTEHACTLTSIYSTRQENQVSEVKKYSTNRVLILKQLGLIPACLVFLTWEALLYVN